MTRDKITRSFQLNYKIKMLLKISNSSCCSTCFLQLVLPPVSTVMAGPFQRALKLRTALRCLYDYNTLSRSTATLSPVDFHGPFLTCSSEQVLASTRKLYAGADGSKVSPSAAPERLPFCRVTEEDLAFFRKILPSRTIVDPDLVEPSNVDWLKSVRGEGYN